MHKDKYVPKSKEKTDAAPASSGGVMAIQLVLEVLELLAKQDNVGVTELARLLGTTKARVFRHLRTLVDQGYAVQDSGSERYSAGPRLIALARVAALNSNDVIVRLAAPTMVKLRDEFGHTVNLSLVYGETAEIVQTLQGNAFIGVVMQTNAAMPLHSTAAGKLLLADMMRRGRALPQNLEKFTSNTITDPAALRADLAACLEQGWAGAPEETVLGINALSAPIHDHRGELVGMISLLSSIQFIAREPSAQMIDGVKAAAAEISKALSL